MTNFLVDEKTVEPTGIDNPARVKMSMLSGISNLFNIDDLFVEEKEHNEFDRIDITNLEYVNPDDWQLSF